MSKNLFKTKTIILFVSIFIIIGLALIPIDTDMVFAEEEENLYDRIFYQSANELLESEGALTDIDLKKNVIYDIDLKKLGYIYLFDINDSQGYAIIINSNNNIKTTEFVFDAQSPYAFMAGVPIYVVEFTYAVYNDEVFYMSDNNRRLDRNQLLMEYPSRYCGIGDSLGSKTYTVDYIDREINEFSMATTIPSYYYEAIPNACVPIAAGNVIAFYDRYKTNLIENYTPGMGLGSLYKYKNQNESIDALMNQLCIDMGTNSEGVGNNLDEFEEGMQLYCERQGYTVSFTSFMSGNSFNYNAAVEKIESNIPIIMFLRKVELSSITENTNSDYYFCRYGSINHSLSVFGYREIDYTLNNNTHREDEFLLVATGIKNMPRAYLNMNNNLVVDEAYAVNIV